MKILKGSSVVQMSKCLIELLSPYHCCHCHQHHHHRHYRHHHHHYSGGRCRPLVMWLSVNALNGVIDGVTNGVTNQVVIVISSELVRPVSYVTDDVSIMLLHLSPNVITFRATLTSLHGMPVNRKRQRCKGPNFDLRMKRLSLFHFEGDGLTASNGDKWFRIAETSYSSFSF